MAKDITEALRLLTDQATTPASTPEPLAVRGEAPVQKSAALNTGKTGTNSGGGGISSPLTETAYLSRTWHPDFDVTSSDGLFVITIKPVKTINFLDASSAAVQLVFDHP